jgi:CubicO group peptidase (beta-lactamase class C family)
MTTATGRFAAAFAMAVADSTGGGAQQPAQDRPATARLMAYLKAFNSSDPADVRRFIEDNFNRQAAEQATIRHLLTMTSGIGDFFGPRYQATPKERIRSLKDYLPLFADLPLEFAPGTGHRHSNGGYVVLGAIIEKASGEDYYSYVREHVFKPAGMLATDSYPRDAATPNLALGYTSHGRSDRERVLNVDTLPGRGSSAGGGYSTAKDMLKYVRALASGTLVLPDLRGGLGIAGGAPGINAAVEWDARTGYVVIVMATTSPASLMPS